MSLPVVAIVGRPNVGKSSLFNWLAGRRISIVDPTAGVTRDRVSAVVQFGDRYCELVDTGGMGILDADNLTADVERQIRHAIDEAAVVLFLVDVRDGLVPLDHTVAERLRTVNKPVVFVANKADDPKFDPEAAEFLRLGYGEPIPVSAHQLRGRDELVAAILAKLRPPGAEEAPPADPVLKIAIVGRRNVGKSTFINSLAQADRVIVSEVPGTTRDSIDVRFERDGKAFLAIDTAGVRKKKSLASDIEFYSLHRAERSIRRADVVLHLFDPRLRVSRVDKQLAEYIVEHHKPAVFVVNKWDLARDTIPTEKWADYLRSVFPMLDYVPIAFITAKKGKNVYRLLNLAQQLHKQAGRRMRTGELNRVIQQAMQANSPPMRHNRVPKVYYATQVGTRPPTIVLVTNGPELFDDTYVRYLTKVLRDHSPFGEVAVRLVLRSKAEAAGGGKETAEPELVQLQPADQVPEDTMEVPALATEPPVDPLEPVRVQGREEHAKLRKKVRPDAPARPRRKKKRPDAGTWNL
jgi:GTP-binding protein